MISRDGELEGGGPMLYQCSRSMKRSNSAHISLWNRLLIRYSSTIAAMCNPNHCWQLPLRLSKGLAKSEHLCSELWRVCPRSRRADLVSLWRWKLRVPGVAGHKTENTLVFQNIAGNLKQGSVFPSAQPRQCICVVPSCQSKPG